MRHPIILAAAMLASSLALALPAAAGPAAGDELPQRVVRTDDLDLAHDAGLRELYARIRRAVDALCPAPAGDVARHARGLACRREVLQRAIEEAGVPRLAELHRGARPAGRLAHR